MADTKNPQYFKKGEPAPDVTLLDESGKKVTLVSFWQEKPTLLVFLRHFG
jgi:peroxiredoxin